MTDEVEPLIETNELFIFPLGSLHVRCPSPQAARPQMPTWDDGAPATTSERSPLRPRRPPTSFRV